jgi:polysaccharide pyruvyl transferase WcaK-like protein
LAEGSDEARAIVLPATYDSDVQQVVRSASLVVGAQYHSAVFVVNNARPLLCLLRKHKMVHMLKGLGLDEHSLLTEDLMTQSTGIKQAREGMKAVLREKGWMAAKTAAARETAADTVQRSFACFVAKL